MFFSTFVILLSVLAAALGLLIVSKLIAPSQKRLSKDSLSAYECGEVSNESFRVINIPFLKLAILYLFFEIEGIFLFLVVPRFSDWMQSGKAHAFIGLFFLFLFVVLEGLFLFWKQGDLQWSR